MNKNKKITFLQLNELNFDFIKEYVDDGLKLPGFQKIFNFRGSILRSEDKYELLEPWIQWVSIHTGLNYSEHKTFRLGDAVKSNTKTIFEQIEKKGYSVGAISPMNVVNRLNQPKFFIPDPWIDTNPDNSWVSQFTYKAMKQLVNDNSSGKIKLSTIFQVMSVSVFLLEIKDIYNIIRYIFKAKNGKKWFKALAFDFFISKIYLKLKKKFDPDFSVLFLNGCAHIQHHYFLSSKFNKKENKNPNPSWYVNDNDDPFLDMIIEYDKIIQNIIPNNNIIICTGLSQKKVDETIFYYRLKNHDFFLQQLGLKFQKIEPRMSRDFLVKFSSSIEMDNAYNILKKLYVNGKTKLFGIIDKRDNELFITLDYPYEINDNTFLTLNKKKNTLVNLRKNTSLVAIKNGLHSDKCFFFVDKNFSDPEYLNGQHCKEIYNYILKQYQIS